MIKPMNKEKGFTLVETLVAVGILVIAILGTFTAAQSGLSSTIFSKEQIAAFELAQEGVEQIRNIRDQNGLLSQPWLTGISASPSDPCYFGNTCTVDAVKGGVPTKCTGGAGSCPILRQDSSTGFFSYSPLTLPLSPYRREIQLTSINDHEASILVTVYWSKGPVNNKFSVRENIFNWQ
jgi:prepilin-type N-terminal cleavage/methylation domain-containing protein